MKKSFLVFLFFSILYSVNAQHQQVDTVIFAGKKMLRVITEKGDTAYLDQLDEVSVSSKKQFGSKDEYDRYMRYRRYAAIVYPYALEAMRIYHESKEATRSMTRREQKKYMKTLERELEEQFEEPLKKLTRTQGLILTKMIEKELNEPFYDVIKEIKGTWSAFYYNTSGRFYGYHLRDGYKRGEDYILDMVLDDYRLNIKR
ncbi:MAG: DUF4294 domain-containing protein [Saprospiraceae bacterium]|jgi:hypothetical protein|nr:DUF4294 domain-containing protein [Saprospiraceae bacterium]HMT77669.1 DUF4294 domain-containing protein [Saprospiraceae bacterium]HQU95468.1 DUF4294 domain-containing protein [Saprospiraceae bacterium]HQW95187.1 DUF4294 domain-containing protein [Saprospiraceae bacterium]